MSPSPLLPGSSSHSASLVDVLDRVLDKGLVVASIDTYLKYAEAVGASRPISRPAAEGRSYDELMSENASLRAQLGPARTRKAVGTRKRASTRA